MSGKASRRKGHDYEREVAKLYRQHGFIDAKRGYQNRSGADEPDVKGLPFWVECKHYGKPPSAWTAIEQAETAIDEGDGGQMPVAHLKHTRCGSLVAIREAEWFRIVERLSKLPDWRW